MANDAVEQIKSKLDITEVLAPYVELKAAGKSLKGKSPFTNEKTPSFHVSPERGMYYCFSTSQGGDMFTFIQVMEGVDFKGALKILADKAGVQLVPEDPKKRDERDTQYAVMEAATKFYESTLPTCADAVAYLKARKVTGVTAKEWRIGYAPDAWRDTKIALEAERFSVTAQRQAGLIKGEQNKEPYDVFRDRIMFPINDPSGRVIAFSGRILSKESDAPKYVNSPETMLFKKSEALFGYDKAKNSIRTMDFSLIVEGQFDVVLAHQAGYHNTVAVSGTALTPEHVALLSRLSKRCVLALDADRAGIAAVKRAAEVMLAKGMDVKVARLPDGEDPADIIADDIARFKKLIGQSTHVIEFLLAVHKEQSKDERALKLAVRESVLPYVLLIPNHIDQDHFIGVIAAALDSGKEAIRLEVERLREQASRHVAPAKSAEVVPAPQAAASVREVGREKELQAYFVASYQFLPAAYQKAVAKTYEQIMGVPITTSDQIESTQLNKLLFSLENEFTAMPKRQLADEVASKLEQLRQLRLRQELAASKAALIVAEKVETADLTEQLQQIQEIQKRLIDEAITVDIFAE